MKKSISFILIIIVLLSNVYAFYEDSIETENYELELIETASNSENLILNSFVISINNK